MLGVLYFMYRVRGLPPSRLLSEREASGVRAGDHDSDQFRRPRGSGCAITPPVRDRGRDLYAAIGLSVGGIVSASAFAGGGYSTIGRRNEHRRQRGVIHCDGTELFLPE